MWITLPTTNLRRKRKDSLVDENLAKWILRNAGLTQRARESQCFIVTQRDAQMRAMRSHVALQQQRRRRISGAVCRH